MSSNGEIARIFREMASILEITGANAFRVNAHARVARVLEEMTVDVATMDAAALEAVEGIGAKSAKKIVEFARTGRVAEHDEMLAEVPAGLLDVLAIPGLGPKSVKVLWEQGGVTDVPSLREAIDSGRLEGLPRMGKKTVENIRSSMEFLERAGTRTLLGTALPLAEAMVARLQAADFGATIECAGSLRRGRETIGDIDLVASSSDPHALAEAFRSMPGVSAVLAAGDTKSSIRLERGVQVDLRVVEADAYGAALLYFTGSKDHNVILRERAVRAGMRLNEYGLFPDDDDPEPPQRRGVKPLASRTEAEIYAALDLPWMSPEVREARGEIGGPPDDLVELADVVSELHAHTTASDGRWTIEELAREAMRRGFHTVAVTDHSHASAQAGGLDPDELRRHAEAVREVDERLDGIRVLAGSEVDILADGRLDYDDDVLAALDIVIASPHVALRQDRETATRRLLGAIRHPLVHIIGHPTGRIIGRRAGLDPDIEALVEAAAAHDTALEINANALRLDLRDTHVRAAVEGGALIAIDTDAHAAADLDHLRYGVLTARRGWLTRDRCVNTWTAERLGKWLAR